MPTELVTVHECLTAPSFLGLSCVVCDCEELLRRIHPNHIDQGTIMALALRDRAGEVSVHRPRLRAMSSIKQEYPNYVLGALSAGECRAAGFEVQENPTQADPSHALVLKPGTDHRTISKQLLPLLKISDGGERK